MLLWILMMAAPVIIGGILKLVRKDAASGGKHSAKSRPAVAVSTNVPSVRVQQAGPSLPAAELAIKSHVLKAALVAAAGVVLVLLALIWSFSVKPEGEIFMFLMFLGGGYCLYSASGRFWATGVRPSDWADAEVSTWRVTHHETNEDAEGLASWFDLTVAPVQSGDKQGLPAERTLAVRMYPTSPTSDGQWVGENLMMLERDDGCSVISRMGKNRFFRSNGESPWDFVDAVGGTSSSSSYDDGTRYLDGAYAAVYSILTPSQDKKKPRDY